MLHQKMIYKILTLEEFDEFNKNKKFVGNPLDREDGYMHFSNKEQYPKVIQKFFPDQKVVVLEIYAAKIAGTLKFESNVPNGEQYPHLYGGYFDVQDVVNVINID